MVSVQNEGQEQPKPKAANQTDIPPTPVKDTLADMAGTQEDASKSDQMSSEQLKVI